MEKIVMIDGKEIPMKTSGATCIRYYSVFREDLFASLQRIQDKVSKGDKLPDGAVDCLMKAAYIAALQANPKEKRSYEEWFDQFSFMGALDVMDIYDMLLADQATIEEAKKNNDRQSAE